MSRRDWRDRIEDILEAITEIQTFVADPGILWDTVHHDLPKLVDPLKKLLG